MIPTRSHAAVPVRLDVPGGEGTVTAPVVDPSEGHPRPGHAGVVLDVGAFIPVAAAALSASLHASDPSHRVDSQWLARLPHRASNERCQSRP